MAVALPGQGLPHDGVQRRSSAGREAGGPDPPRHWLGRGRVGTLRRLGLRPRPPARRVLAGPLEGHRGRGRPPARRTRTPRRDRRARGGRARLDPHRFPRHRHGHRHRRPHPATRTARSTPGSWTWSPGRGRPTPAGSRNVAPPSPTGSDRPRWIRSAATPTPSATNCPRPLLWSTPST
jgi:hypothetical protein